MEYFIVYHLFTIENSWGEIVRKKEAVCVFEDKADAEAFVNKYNKPYNYREDMKRFHCFEYKQEKIKFIKHEEFELNKQPEDYGIMSPLESGCWIE